MQVELFAGTWCLSEERRLRRKKIECHYCDKQVKSFSVPNLSSMRHQVVLFCSECNRVLIKPKRFYEDASGGMKVKIQFESDKIEESCRDYPTDPREIPIKLAHDCYDGSENNLVRYGRRLKHDHGDYETIEEYWECPKCLQEKILKHQKKLTCSIITK